MHKSSAYLVTSSSKLAAVAEGSEGHRHASPWSDHRSDSDRGSVSEYYNVSSVCCVYFGFKFDGMDWWSGLSKVP